MPQVTVGEPAAATVTLDRERLGQAALNCVMNALRSAETVEVRLEHTPPWLEVIVDDDGAGWPAVRDELLQPFQSRAGSTGLGLAVVNAVATAHGGNVHLLDSPLGGARVRIRIPAH
jgi:two-component system osmolarity sensor histidine kinase EnvZ